VGGSEESREESGVFSNKLSTATEGLCAQNAGLNERNRAGISSLSRRIERTSQWEDWETAEVQKGIKRLKKLATVLDW